MHQGAQGRAAPSSSPTTRRSAASTTSALEIDSAGRVPLPDGRRAPRPGRARGREALRAEDRRVHDGALPRRRPRRRAQGLRREGRAAHGERAAPPRRHAARLPPQRARAAARQAGRAARAQRRDHQARPGVRVEHRLRDAASVEVAPGAARRAAAGVRRQAPAQRDGKVEITTDYPDYFPFVDLREGSQGGDSSSTSSSRTAAATRTCKLLERLLTLRSEKAKLLGYATLGRLRASSRAWRRTPKTVRAFLDAGARGRVKAPAKAELAELREGAREAAAARRPTSSPPSDRYYLEDRVREGEVQASTRRSSPTTSRSAPSRRACSTSPRKMYGLEYKEVPAKAWHPDVTAYEVLRRRAS